MGNGARATLRIDLNRLNGDRISTSTRFTESGFVPDLELGDVVEVVEAGGDRYLARVEGFGGHDGNLVYLRVDLDYPLVGSSAVEIAPASFAGAFDKTLKATPPLVNA